AGQAEILAVSREPGLTQGVVRHVPRLIEPADQAQQGDLLVERLSVALPADLVEAIACRLEVDLLAKGDWVIAHDDAHVLAPIRYRLRLTLDQLSEAYLQQLVVIRCRISAPIGVVGEHPEAAVRAGDGITHPPELSGEPGGGVHSGLYRVDRPQRLPAQGGEKEGVAYVSEPAGAGLGGRPLVHRVVVALGPGGAFDLGPPVVVPGLDDVELVPGVLPEFCRPQLAAVVPGEALR